MTKPPNRPSPKKALANRGRPHMTPPRIDGLFATNKPRRPIAGARRAVTEWRTRHSAAQTDVLSRQRSRRYGGLTAIGRRGAAALEVKSRLSGSYAGDFPRTGLRHTRQGARRGGGRRAAAAVVGGDHGEPSPACGRKRPEQGKPRRRVESICVFEDPSCRLCFACSSSSR